MHLIAAQLVFAYAFDILLTWSRRERYTLGFGPFPVIFSINLFLWFKVDWFYWQFLMIAIGFAAKELIRWNKDGRRAHIFNPSSFPLGLFSLVLIVTGTTRLTWGPEIAITLLQAPHIYLLIFAVSLPAQVLFGVASMTLSAVATTYGLGLVYYATTGTYLFNNASIPIAVFLGMHLLFNDPSTSPRTELGRIMFGALYGLGVMILFGLLGQNGIPTHYDKLLAVPILNLMIKGIDTLARSRVLGRVDPATIGATLSPRRRNLAYIAVWVVVFAVMQVQTGAQVALARADRLFDDGQTEVALAHYRELVRNEPDYALAHSNLGYVLRSVGRHVEAVAVLRRAVELEPDNAEMHYNLGLALIQADQVREAVETLQQAVLLQPDYPEAHHELGQALFSDGQTEAAIAQYREVLKTEPNSALLHHSLGYALLSMERPAEAVLPLRRAVELEPDNAEAHNNLGLALILTVQFREAVEILQQAILLKADYPEAHYNLAHALAGRGEAVQAADEFRAALRIRPDYAAALRDLALILTTRPAVDARDPAEAVRLALRAAELTERRDPAMLDVLSLAYAAEHRFDEAIETAEMAERVVPDSTALAAQIKAHLSLYRQGRRPTP